ncbi:acetylornithine deacetylase/succinyl-diaminopimelate desuccinylase-like protein [Arcanobacterium pluranimalium]|uniref:M20/M25/M40 family metallo-hydrolase n=1 Tax=Arcanobacterium pluranimalium TaxID=108028 RepID=UPI00195B44BE|nr:M20/M25/M40 family metallo-hydrolase [Arcanobacterium pluranimalium]MBM7825363.1 acetylornithine deacetylase/succinyl-diaminopimelate desuccinylase-like protein [Arcanobacterium pluranimalium]
MTSFQPSSGDFSDVVEIAQQLIRIDTSNHGVIEADVETQAAHYVMELLQEVGYEPQWIEPVKGRPSVVLRVPGKNRERGGLVIHGHLDVVPAVAQDWDVDPFSGEIIDGVLWGRGAVDMKNMDAMIISVLRHMARTNYVPERDLIVAMFADEEAGGKVGAHWLVEHKPELFAGATHAISEVGGYNTYVNGKRVYLLQTAEKGLTWYKLLARGKAGHGSQVNEDNAVTKLAQALAAIGSEKWQLQLTDTVRELLAGVSELTGLPFDPEDPETIDRLIDALGSAKTFVGATLRTGANPTQLQGGYKVNVIPQTAEGGVDVRPIPGTEAEVARRIAQLAGDVELEKIHDDAGIEFPFAGETVEAMVRALEAEDPQAVVLPYMLSAGTDNKALARLGIQGYGFAPVQLPPGFDFPAMFHAANERIPVDSLYFGSRVLWRFLQNA